MTEHLPDKPRIDRAAVERIIQRAAELQARDHDIGDGLTEQELMRLGQEVGIPSGLLQQALLEERTRAMTLGEGGLLEWLTGPPLTAAQRSLPGAPEEVEAALSYWMTDRELMTVKRRFPDRTSWEARKDMFSSLRRELKLGGGPYRLARSEEIVAQVVPLEQGWSHVRLLADLANTRRSHLAGAATMAGAGAIATVIGVTLSVALPVAAIPAALGVLAGFAIARRRRAQVEEVHVALEQVLDRLEHREIVPPAKTPKGGAAAIERIANEIRKNLGL